MQRAKAYALAVIERVHDGTHSSSETVASSLLATLANKGESNLLPKIMREIDRELKRRATIDGTTLMIARKADEKYAREAIEATHVQIDRVVVDDRLVGGFTYGSARSYTDQSYRSQLIQLFNSLV